MRKLIIGTVSALLLASCASAPTEYQPLAKNGVGYKEIQIESNRYRVTFAGGAKADRLETEALALRRAAELTVENGYDWFRVVRDENWTEGSKGSSGRPSVGIGASGGSGGGVGVGMGVGIDLTPDRSRPNTLIEILMGKGEKPDGDRDVHDARAILTAQNSYA